MKAKNKLSNKTPWQSRQTVAGLPALKANVAGIDLGSEQHWVCAPALDGVGREVADFGGTTAELLRLAAWLRERKVEAVAMESTGVYWIAPHEVLEGQGLTVLLADTRHLSQVPGRDKKSDPSDCEWLQRLHSCGLLKGAFRPKEDVCMLRTLVRDKGSLVAESGDWIRRMQKSLDQMNVRLHRAVSQVHGTTGIAILRAIVGGERDPDKLAQLRDPRCRHSQEEIAEQLRGHWREDHLFSLKQSLAMYDNVQERLSAYDEEILRRLAAMQPESTRGSAVPPVKNAEKAQKIRRDGQEPMRAALYLMSGVDLASIDAIGVGTVQVVLSEYGPDLSRFDTEKQFVSHLRLAPFLPSSGGKPLKKKRQSTASTRVAAALRMAAAKARPARAWRLPCAWPPPPCATAKPPWAPTTGRSPGEPAATWPCLPPRANWPPSFTACFAGDNHMPTMVPQLMNGAMSRAASPLSNPKQASSDISWFKHPDRFVCQTREVTGQG